MKAEENCLGCWRCETESVKKLIDGRIVCTSCPDYMIECEARHLLSKPLLIRREMLARLESKRGKASVDKLKSLMIDIHHAGKN